MNTKTIPAQALGLFYPTIPKSWMPSAKMQRIHVHWTAGTHYASEFDKKHYHLLVTGSGSLVRGSVSIKANEAGSKIRPRASHTLNANTGAIGISLCCMGGKDVRERPFVAGKYPMTKLQWDTAMCTVAQLAYYYQIPVLPERILTHAEVEPVLGIKQRQKWDITRLAFDNTIQGAMAVGDLMRREVMVWLDRFDAHISLGEA